MTGYGQNEKMVHNQTISVELKTLNSKFLDLNNLKLPRELSDKENEIRTLIQNELKRGKVSLQIDIETQEDAHQPISINEALLKSYHKKYQSLATQLGEKPADLFKLALNSPDVIVQNEAQSALSWQELKEVILPAIEQCQQHRVEEGKSLATKLESYISVIRSKSGEIQKLIPERQKSIRSRLEKSLEEIKNPVQVDENRFEQELIYYLEKIDVTEEQVRLTRHLDYFLEVLKMPESQGKKLGFICQEMGREINTLGAKAYEAHIQQLVVEMKDELEKIKEQLLNIL